MGDKPAMLRETVEAFTDLRAMFDELTEERASRVWLGVLGVRAEGSRAAGDGWAPGSFWGMRYPIQRDGSRTAS